MPVLYFRGIREFENGGVGGLEVTLTRFVDLFAKLNTIGRVDILEHKCRFQQITELLCGEHHRFAQQFEVLDMQLEDVERLC